jgi:hypothetical protein
MMIRWLLAGIMLAAFPAVAAETAVDWGLTTGLEPRSLCVYDTSTLHTCVPIGKLDSTAHTFNSLGNTASVCNVAANGADPTGVADSSPALIACAAKVVNGQKANIYLPAGTYLLKSRITVGDQCLFGDGRGNSFIRVDRTFDPAADSVIKLLGTRNWTVTGSSAAPCVHDIDIQFDQPFDQGVRANFKTLAAGCTSALGGTGCKYPPAIYNDNGTSGGRPRLYNIRIERAWDGINLQAAGGMMIDNIEEGSLDAGLTLANGGDFGYVSHWEHHSQFGLPSTAALYTGVYQDGGTFAAVIHRTDGVYIHDMRIWQGRVKLDTGFSWGTFDGLFLDGNNSTLDIANVSDNQIGLRIIGGYQTGTSSGVNTDCPVQVDSTVLGEVIISSFFFSSSVKSSLCVAGGVVDVSGSNFVDNTVAAAATVVQTGGYLQIENSQFGANTGAGVYSFPVISQTGGSIRLISNYFRSTPQAGSVNVMSLTDSVDNYAIANQFGGWTFAPPGPLGTYGPNGQKCNASGASPRACNGWSGAVTTAALTNPAFTTSTYVITDTSVVPASLVRCSIQAYAGAGVPIITQCVPTAGTITATIYNAHNTAALNAAVTIGFTIQ